MNKFFWCFSIPLLLCSCLGKHDSKAQSATVNDEKTQPSNTNGVTVNIDLANSTVHWKGTKMLGAGKHEGDVDLTSANLHLKNNQITGGFFTVDMTTIAVTDIPESDPVPINTLNNHLKSSDFFDVAKFPTSKFEITNSAQITSDSVRVSGNLTLKDVTKNIEFNALYQDNIFSTTFTFDRFQWNIAYEGITNKTMVDKDIEMKIKLVH